MTRFSLAACLLLSVGSAGAADRRVPADDDVRLAVLELLHDGRFDEADALTSRIVPHGEDTTEAFFRSFVTYWRLLYDPKNDDLRDELSQRLDRTIELGKVAGKTGQNDVALWHGSAHLLRAQLRAAQKKVFAAGFDAKKANRLLKQAVAEGSHAAESEFGLGTYEYFADRVPGIVKALRALLSIPGGDRERGLERLKRASANSRFFSLEARMLLAAIYSDDDERLYDLALAEAEAAIDAFPGKVAVLHGVARLEQALARPSRALARLERASELAGREAGTAPVVLASLRYSAGEAELDRFRPDRALDQLRPLVESPQHVPVNLREPVDRLAGTAVLLLDPAPAWAASVERDKFRNPVDAEQRELLLRAARSLALAREGLELERGGRLQQSARVLESLAAGHPDDDVLALLVGRALMLADREAEARDRLTPVATNGAVPSRWAGPSRLLAGMAADLSGQRESALEWYERAEQIRFGSRDAARMCQRRTCTRADLDPPSPPRSAATTSD